MNQEATAPMLREQEEPMTRGQLAQGIARIAWECIKQCPVDNYVPPVVLCVACQLKAEALLSAQEAPAPPAGQPMATADRDAEHVIVYDPSYACPVVPATWDRDPEEEGGQCWRATDAVSDRLNPLCWWSMPHPPSTIPAKRAQEAPAPTETVDPAEQEQRRIGDELHEWLTSQFPDFDADTSGEDSADLLDHLKVMFRRALADPSLREAFEAGWQPIETAPTDESILMWSPIERLYSPDLIARNPDVCHPDVRVSTTRHWCWATLWQPLPPMPDLRTRGPR